MTPNGWAQRRHGDATGARGRTAPAQKVMVRARAPALYGSPTAAAIC